MFWKKKKEEKKDREIFRYFDGKRDRSIDPLPVWRAMWDDPDTFDPKVDVQEAEEGNWDRSVAFVTKHFDVQPFDPETEEGLTTYEITDVLYQFFKFIEEVKKKRVTTLISSPPSESSSSPQKTETTTPSDSGSSSTPPESPSDEPSECSTPSSVEAQEEESISPGTTP